MNFKKTGVNVVALEFLVAGLWSKRQYVPRAAQDEWLQGGTVKVSASPVRGENAEMAASGPPNQELLSILNQFCSYIWKHFLAQPNKNRAVVEEPFFFLHASSSDLLTWWTVKSLIPIKLVSVMKIKGRCPAGLWQFSLHVLEYPCYILITELVWFICYIASCWEKQGDALGCCGSPRALWGAPLHWWHLSLPEDSL